MPASPSVGSRFIPSPRVGVAQSPRLRPPLSRTFSSANGPQTGSSMLLASSSSSTIGGRSSGAAMQQKSPRMSPRSAPPKAFVPSAYSKDATDSPRSPLQSARALDYEMPHLLTRAENKLDQREVVQLAKEVTAQLAVARRRKDTLSKQIAALRKRETAVARKAYDVKIKSQGDTVKTKEENEKFKLKSSDVKVLENTLTGLQRDSGNLSADIAQLRQDYKSVEEALKAETAAIAEAQQELHRKRATLAAAQRESIEMQARLRGSRVAAQVVAERFRDVERRNKAVRSCITGVTAPQVSTKTMGIKANGTLIGGSRSPRLLG
ncbi:unnamed protein product [Amoebophrya sp. A25]|nr:unnamed protein product [Amoebophrya sp. A25]|eukprot:GSA25T00000415001.1